MDKNEILEKSRKEKPDEYSQKILRDASNFMLTVLAVICVVFAFGKIAFLGGLPVTDIAAILMFCAAAGNGYAYYKLRSKERLISCLCFIFAGIVCTVMYFSTMLGVLYGR